MKELILMIVFSTIYLIWGFSIVFFPEKFRKKVEKLSINGIRMLGFCIAGVSIISLGWIYFIFAFGRLMGELSR
jgi:hypothetical protein